MEAKNCPPSRLDLNPVNFLLWRALQQKLYHQEIRDVSSQSCCVTLLGPISQDTIKEMPDQLLKTAAMVIGHIVYMLNSS